MEEVNVPQPAPRSPFKFVLLMIAIGIVTTLAIVSIYMPRMILWYFDPPQPMGITCTSSIRWAVDRLLVTQLYSIGVGAVIGLLIGLKFARRKPVSVSSNLR